MRSLIDDAFILLTRINHGTEGLDLEKEEEINSVLSGEINNQVLFNFIIDEEFTTFGFEFAKIYCNEVYEITGKDLLEDIPMEGDYDKFCLRMNSLTEDECMLLELNNIRVHENLKIKQEDEVEYE